jgi:multicomponent Na+:H+ antiporter subunit A
VLKPTPETPHEGGLTLWMGPALFGLAGLGVLFLLGSYGELLLAPMASSIVGDTVESHLTFLPTLDALPIWLSVATWGLGVLVYWKFDRIRAALATIEQRVAWSWDKGFDQAMFSLIRFAGAWTRAMHHGRLELYLLVIVALFFLSVFVPLATMAGWPSLPALPRLTPYEWGAVALAVAGVAMVVVAQTRLGAIIALGVQGLAVALIFLFYGAPDLAFTQFMVETLSVVILALVMTRLNLSVHDRRVFEDWLRDGGLSVLAGAGIAVLLMKVVEGVLDPRLSTFFLENSVPIGHGHNVVNVILVDFRGLDTLGEISVVMTAGIAVLALLRRQHKRKPLQDAPARRPRARKAAPA